MRVDLLWSGEGDPPVWTLGETVCIPADARLGQAVDEHAATTDAVALLHWALPCRSPTEQLLRELLARTVDVWHAGLLLGLAAKPASVDAVAPTWMLNRDADPATESTSWRMSLSACLVRTEVVHALGHADPCFSTLAGASLELGHRWLSAGALMRYTPLLVQAAHSASDEVPIDDELRLILRRYGRRWTWWAAWRLVARGAPPYTVMNALRRVTREGATPSRAFQRTFVAAPAPPQRVTVLIPTLDRYPWLEVVLRQLGAQTVAPHEVIVVDQSALLNRRNDLVESFPTLPLRVLYLDHPGQSTARNTGIAASTGDAILFLDDDEDLPPDLIEHHLERVAPGDISASCGVAVEPGEDWDADRGPLRASSVFPAGNTLLRRSALEASGLFDLAFDHGVRADADLGMRLYLSGAHLVLDPSNKVFHHRAPVGGLREYGARKSTYRGSRSSYLERNKVAATEIYLARRYFTKAQVQEALLLRKAGTLSRHGNRGQRLLRLLLQLGLLPRTSRQIRAECEAADQLATEYPIIPHLQSA